MKSLKKLVSFVWYCIVHRHQGFWQALANWSDYGFIYRPNNFACYDEDIEDIFYIEQ